jgi:polysaccharide export outer membrane protein
MLLFFKNSRYWLAAAAAFALTGCAAVNGAYGESPNLQLVDATELPPPLSATEVALGEYVIGPGDEVSVNVFGVEDMSVNDARVDGSGRISVPFTGSVEIAGLTPAEAEARIAERLRSSYVRDPRVSVNVSEMVSRRVTVAGQVTKPGSYPVLGEMGLIRAVAEAQGLAPYARKSDVVVFRTVGNQKMAALYNLGAIERGNYADPRIYPDDVIVVGDSPQRRLFEDFMRAASLLVSPLVLLVQ